MQDTHVTFFFILHVTFEPMAKGLADHESLYSVVRAPDPSWARISLGTRIFSLSHAPEVLKISSLTTILWQSHNTFLIMLEELTSAEEF